jgi:hypothetical protein
MYINVYLCTIYTLMYIHVHSCTWIFALCSHARGLQGPLFDTIHNSLNVKLLGEPYCMGAHLTTFPATYQWMHDPDTFPVSSDVKRLPQELRPHALNQSYSGSMQNGIRVHQGLLGFTHDMVTSLLPILNPTSADTAARPYKLLVLKASSPL